MKIEQKFIAKNVNEQAKVLYKKWDKKNVKIDRVNNKIIKSGKIYFLTNFSEIKIGFTTLTPEKRLKQLNTGSSNQLYLLGYITGTMQTESDLHKRFDFIRVRRNGEWFYGTDELIDYINEVNEWPNKYVIKNEFMDNKIMAMDTI